MSAEDIWYFLKGQETVGPFSKAIMQQIHAGGQLLPETMVWREGMAEWKPARDVAELELASAATPPADEAAPAKTEPAPGPPGRHDAVAPGTHGKLKLKAAGDSPAPAPVHVPPPTIQPKHSPLKMADDPKPLPTSPKPVSPLPPSSPASPGLVAATEPDPAEEKQEKKKKDKKDEKPSFIKRAVAYIFSSMFMAPLFLIVCGVLIFLSRAKFPDVLWVTWLIVGFGGVGVLSICSIRSFDGMVRLLAFLLLVPPIVLFWPVFMSELPVQAVPAGYWVFLVFCFFYMLTTRIGLNNYISTGSAKFASVSGVLLIAFIVVVGHTDIPEQRIPGWKEFVEKGSRLRLPGPLARMLNLPDYGTEAGHLVLASGHQQSRHGIESAVLKQKDEKEYQLVFRTLEGIQFFTKIPMPEGGFTVDKILNQDCPVLFKPLDATGDDVYEGATWLMKNGQTVTVTSARLKVESVDKESNTWKGTITFLLKPEKGSDPIVAPGQFETIVTESKP